MVKNTLTDEELNELTAHIEEIDVIIGQIINHGIPDEYREFLLEKLQAIGGCNSKCGRILDVWVDA